MFSVSLVEITEKLFWCFTISASIRRRSFLTFSCIIYAPQMINNKDSTSRIGAVKCAYSKSCLKYSVLLNINKNLANLYLKHLQTKWSIFAFRIFQRGTGRKGRNCENVRFIIYEVCIWCSIEGFEGGTTLWRSVLSY